MSKFVRIGSYAFIGALAALPAWAQRTVTYEEMQAIKGAPSVGSLFGEAIFTLFVMGLFAALLFFFKRDMKGWDQPVKEVWFSFSGRLNRKAYWLKGVVLLSLVQLGAQVAILLLQIPVVLLFGGLSPVLAIVSLVVLLPLVVLQLWAGLAIAVKRAHDLNHSGWWLFTVLIPIYNIWVMIQLYFLRGFVGPNTFGPDPIDPVYDYVDEVYGDEDGEGDAPSAPRVRPQPPQGGNDAPKGFGSAKFKAKPAAKPTANPETPTETGSPQASGDNMDVIRRRLGGDVAPDVARKPRD